MSVTTQRNIHEKQLELSHLKVPFQEPTWGEFLNLAQLVATLTAFCVHLPSEWEGLRNRASPSRHMVGKADWENGWQDCKHTIYTSRPSIV